MPTDAHAYSDLAAALRERLRVIGDRAARERDSQAHLRQLQDASERIASLQTELPGPVPPQLRHFLERCSYDKALAWIEQGGT
jgi:hypothetical protein